MTDIVPTVLSVSGDHYSLFMIINCQTCTMRNIACADCVVTAFLAPVVEFVPEVSQSTVEALQVLSSSGLVRPLRYKSAGQG
ncbi:MAG: hypothetical protein NTX12_05190 [Actinobacteria bacterium]|nr:hypothetical protein [Actinomycetota bacterium]